MQIRFERGIHLPGIDLWLDPWDSRPVAFISHAHSDHIGRHQRIFCSGETASLMGERLPGVSVEALPYRTARELDGYRLTLLPAGHILGSAQSFIESEEGSLLYTGDFKLRHGLSCEPAEWCHAETLIMETTFGLPKYRFPSTERVLEEMIEFCRETIADSAVPVLLGYSLGKAQEILCALGNAGLKAMLHGAVYKMTRVYSKLRPNFPCEYERYHEGRLDGHVLICPPSSIRSPMVQKIRNRRVAVLTGWACDPNASFRYQCDAAFPLSDHADFDDLLRLVELVQPVRVLTVHGFAEEFAATLRQRGYDAWPLGRVNQLELGIQVSQPELAIPSQTGEHPVHSFGAFAALGDQIERTPSKNAKIHLLAEFLRNQQDPAELAAAAFFLTGHASRQPVQAGWAVIKRALLEASGVAEASFRQISHHHSDAGKTAREVLQNRPGQRSYRLLEASALFEKMRQASGAMEKTALLKEALADLPPIEGSYIVKILTGDLRIGLKEGLVEEAIAAAFEVPAGDVRQANMLTGDIGEVALLAREKQLDRASLRLFRPIKCMLASPEPTADAVWNRFTEAGTEFILEDKLDGIRAQVHCFLGQMEIFTRDLKRVTAQFPELTGLATQMPAVVLDGEIIAFDEGRRLTFFDLQKRLGRKVQPDFFFGGEIPVIYAAFDLLWHAGESLLHIPLIERRKRLEKLALPPDRFQVVPASHAHSGAEIEFEFAAARARGNEGLIAKDLASTYTPGRRGLAWIKLKKELATLDVVVVGAENGHGKRSQVLSDYTFAVRDDATGALLTIGKAYSGLTDEEIQELTEHFERTTLVNHGRYREVQPEIVLEIAFDSVQPSDRHASGLALRFPRIKGIRRDKSVLQVDTLSHARSLVQP